MKAYKLLSSLIDEAALNVSKLCEHNLECVLISKTKHSMYLNCLKGTLVVIIISYSISEIGLLRIMKPSENRKTHGSAQRVLSWQLWSYLFILVLITISSTVIRVFFVIRRACLSFCYTLSFTAETLRKPENIPPSTVIRPDDPL